MTTQQDTFGIHPSLSASDIRKVEEVKRAAVAFREIIAKGPASRERDQSIIRLEESVMWATKAIANKGSSFGR